MWSLGVILYVMLSGTPAFNPDRRDKDMVKQITEADFSFPDHIWRDIRWERLALRRSFYMQPKCFINYFKLKIKKNFKSTLC